ncbi:MAG: M28 family peptidase, partial [Myxococcota bacterium]|nr:M28 family peptidase [Myxococcota bacterium]
MAALVLVGGFSTAAWMTAMPGRSFRGALPQLTAQEMSIRDGLERHVEHLAGEIGERNLDHPAALAKAATYVREALEELDYEVGGQTFMVKGEEVGNLEVVLPGRAPERGTVVVGAHYDSARGTPGANDNASGVAVLLELARLFQGHAPAATLRLVAYVNEEQPYFGTEHMGSRVHARACAARGERVKV